MGRTMPMPRMEQLYRWDLEDRMAEKGARLNTNMTLPRSLPEDIDPEPRGILEHNVTPLLKRATAQDLQAARNIVKKALAESSKLNKACVSERLRNKYGLRLNVNTHPNWSQISIFDIGSNSTTQFDEVIWIDSAIWDMDQPQFTCSPPCNVKIPPWTGATSTVNYPLITVSQGTWTSTIKYNHTSTANYYRMGV